MDHPRVCGEHPIDRRSHWERRGSSPRMRGTPAFVLDGDGRAGIIPAYAGNTNIYGAGTADSGDHPRVCGEHVVELDGQ